MNSSSSSGDQGKSKPLLRSSMHRFQPGYSTHTATSATMTAPRRRPSIGSGIFSSKRSSTGSSIDTSAYGSFNTRNTSSFNASTIGSASLDSELLEDDLMFLTASGPSLSDSKQSSCSLQRNSTLSSKQFLQSRLTTTFEEETPEDDGQLSAIQSSAYMSQADCSKANALLSISHHGTLSEHNDLMAHPSPSSYHSRRSINLGGATVASSITLESYLLEDSFFLTTNPEDWAPETSRRLSGRVPRNDYLEDCSPNSIVKRRMSQDGAMTFADPRSLENSAHDDRSDPQGPLSSSLRFSPAGGTAPTLYYVGNQLKVVPDKFLGGINPCSKPIRSESSGQNSLATNLSDGKSEIIFSDSEQKNQPIVYYSLKSGANPTAGASAWNKSTRN